MSTQIQRRRGTTTEHVSFTGAAGEITVDTTKDTLIVHDGSTAGGHPLATEANPRFTGNVGIGTSSPSAPLMFGKSVFGEPASEDFYRIKIEDQGGTTNDVGFGQPETNVLGLNARNGHRFYNGSLGESMRIDSSGNVGIGTSSPLTPLHVNAATATSTIIQSANTQSLIHFKSDDTNLFYMGTTGDNWNVQTSGVQRLAVTEAGKCGIGTSSPTEKLEVTGNAILDADNATLKIKGGAAGTTGAINFTFNTDSSAFAGLDLAYDTRTTTGLRLFSGYPLTLESAFNKEILFKRGTTESMRIDSSGNVGIGTSAPNTLLSLRSDNSTIQIDTTRDGTNYKNSTVLFGSPRIDSTDGNFSGGRGKLSCLGNSGSAGGIVWLMAASASLSGNDTDAVNRTKQCGLRLDSGGNIEHWANNSLITKTTGSGNVGIGTSDPGSYDASASQLVIRKDNGAAGITISTPNTSSGSLAFADGTSGSEKYRGFIKYDHSVDRMAIATAGSEKACIDSSGRLLVGTSSAETDAYSTISQFQVKGTNGSSSAGSFTRYQDNGAATVLIAQKSRGASVGSHVIVQSGDEVGRFVFAGSDGTNFIPTADIRSHVDGTPGTDDMPGRLVFSTTADGASSPTERMRIDNAGNVGIGTTAPTEQLTIGNDATSDVYLRINSANNTEAGIKFYGDLSNTKGYRAGYRGNGNLFFIQSDNAGTLADRFVINDSGNVGIGTGSISAKLHVNGQAFFPVDTTFNNVSVTNIAAGTVNGKLFSSSAGILYSSRDATTTANHNFFLNPNGIVGIISTTGSATSYSTSSDYRLKENIVDLTGAIDRVNQLQVHRFNFIADPDTTVDGFIAHEAQEVVPESVTGTKDAMEDIGTLTEWDGTVIETDVTEPDSLTWDETITDEENNETIETRTRTWVKTGDRPVMQGIDQAKLVPLLTAALQEAIAKIENLEQRLSDAGIA